MARTVWIGKIMVRNGLKRKENHLWSSWVTEFMSAESHNPERLSKGNMLLYYNVLGTLSGQNTFPQKILTLSERIL